jgi:hypothetical protein
MEQTMLANTLFAILVITFIAIAALGHALLITAIWPNVLGRRHAPQRDTVADGSQHIRQAR